jgi:DNA processing protein
MINTDNYDNTTLILALIKYADVGPRLFEALFAHFRDPQDILRADVKTLQKLSGMTAKQAQKIAGTSKKLDDARLYLEELRSRDISVATRLDQTYPKLLFELNDPPPMLYVRGKFPDGSRKSVGLIGTSNPTNPGIEMTTRLAKDFAENDVQVISTLRGGIDTAAHLGCKAAGGSSFAILDCGFDALVDSEFMPVAIDIAVTGGVISEYLPDATRPEGALEESNRLLVGFSQAVMVTEVYHNSPQTLDLLNFCHMIGKLVFIMIDPQKGAFADEESLAKALEYGAIPIEGYEKVGDVVRSLV